MSKDQQQLDTIFTAFAHKHRRSIVHHLSLQPASISELAEKEKLSLPAIHKHIAVLERAQIVQRKKSGRCNFLALDRTGFRLVRDWVLSYNVHWGDNNETLENYIAGIEKRSRND